MDRILVVFLSLLILAVPCGSSAETSDTSRERVFTVDGTTVHDVGEVHLHVTNWGMIGSKPGTSSAYATAPSMEYPAGSGVNYLWAAGLWVGARVDGQPRVSTGQFEAEFLPDPDDPMDTIHESAAGSSGGLRFPANADDDSDGLEDEDPLNGRDDDGDGAIDEDYAALGEQYFHAEMSDDTALASTAFPDHRSIGLTLEQESFQWSGEGLEDFVGMRYTIRSKRTDSIEDLVVGMFADFDIGPSGQRGIAEDDLPGFERVSFDLDGETVNFDLAYMYDADGDGGLSQGAVGIALARMSLRSESQSAEDQLLSHAFQRFAGNVSYDRGGDPTNDAERFHLLSQPDYDTTPPLFDAGKQNDYRLLLSFGQQSVFGPNDECVVDLVLVVGDSIEDLRINAARAVRFARGAMYDRDGDASTGVDGKEYRVAWHSAPDLAGTLRGEKVRGTGQLVASVDQTADAVIVRRGRKGLDAREFAVSFDLAGSQVVVDDDRGPWPRVYDLFAVIEGGRLHLAETMIQSGRSFGFGASPIPFNPSVVMGYTLDQAAQVRLQVFDMRGRQVASIVDERLPAGFHEHSWSAQDAQGRSLASGVYFAALTVDGRRESIKLVLSK